MLKNYVPVNSNMKKNMQLNKNCRKYKSPRLMSIEKLKLKPKKWKCLRI